MTAEEDTTREFEMRDSTVPTFDHFEELERYILDLAREDHDYGTAVYAMSMASVATYNYMARQLGVTGFQASCADLDIIKRTSGLKVFTLVDYNNLLYPQSVSIFTDRRIDKDTHEYLKREAQKLLDRSTSKEVSGVATEVYEHWKMLVAGGLPEGVELK